MIETRETDPAPLGTDWNGHRKKEVLLMTRSLLPTLVSALLLLTAAAFLGWLVLSDSTGSLGRIACFAAVAVLFLRVREKDIAAHGARPAALVDLAALAVLAVALRFSLFSYPEGYLIHGRDDLVLASFYLCCAGAIIGHYFRAEFLPRPGRARA